MATKLLIVCVFVAFANFNLSEGKKSISKIVNKRYVGHSGLLPLASLPFASHAAAPAQLPVTHYALGHGGAATASFNVIYPKLYYPPRKYFTPPLFGIAPTLLPSANEIFGSGLGIPTVSAPTIRPGLFSVPVIQPQPPPLLPATTGLSPISFVPFTPALFGAADSFNATNLDNFWRPIVSNKPQTPDISPVKDKPKGPHASQTPNAPQSPSSPQSPIVPQIPNIPQIPQIPNIPQIPQIPQIPNIPQAANKPPIPLESLIPRPAITLLPPLIPNFNERPDFDNSFQGSGVNSQGSYRPEDFFGQGDRNKPVNTAPRYPFFRP